MYAFKKKKVNNKCSAQEIRGKILYSKSEENKRKEIKLRTIIYVYVIHIISYKFVYYSAIYYLFNKN